MLQKTAKMLPNPAKTKPQAYSLKQILSNKSLYIIFVLIGVIYLLSLQPDLPHKPLNEILEDDETFLIPNTSTDLKYILLWTDKNVSPLNFFGEGRTRFFVKKCYWTNCYVTHNRDFFNGSLSQFHAIAFNGRGMSAYDLPKERAPHQKYIYFNMESADNYPVCDDKFDDFFNWTATYKLDSNILLAYILIRNRGDEIIGPKPRMQWRKFPELQGNLEEFQAKNRSKAAAWFVSHCSARSHRAAVAEKLQKALAAYGHTVDIYGRCGPLKCPRNMANYCNEELENNYNFYLSFENSFAEDYVTEKLLTALHHNVIPIVYGGADYSRFLPPGSYLDARTMNVEDLAAKMSKLMNSSRLYQQYFRWKTFYQYSDPSVNENICSVCAALNGKQYDEYSAYKEFRKWWLPDYRKRCQLL